MIRPIICACLLCGLARAAAEPGADCKREAEIKTLIQAAIHQRGIEVPLSLEANLCSALPATPGAGRLEIQSVRWDAVFHVFEFRLRCQPAGGCLPFLVRVPGEPTQPSPQALLEQRSERRPPKPLSDVPWVRPGQTVSLIWVEGGMRLWRQVVCLDLGRAGQQVRTRTQPEGRIVRARVTGPGLLEAGL